VVGFAKVTRDLTERRRVEEQERAYQMQLEETNRDLDAFGYSVSHDLRAPLRAIDGFVKILLEEHGRKLDEDGKRVCDVISRNTIKMGRLIDDLLAFSRMGRQVLEPTRIDMGKLARSVAQEVSEPGRDIRVSVGELPSAFGDAALLRQVWMNLLSNAVKYTRTRAPATIEVSGRIGDGEVVYAVADNGVGFDPRYQDKLFGVFQRLHAASEFEGTGVGLALVHRIVKRHGGWVRAEGKLDEGAMFSFGLPRKGMA
jgi:two-component system sensor kinase